MNFVIKTLYYLFGGKMGEIVNKNLETVHNEIEDEIDLLELIKVLWKNRKLIVTVTFVITILSGVVVFMMPRQYSAELTFTSEVAKKGGLASLAGSLSPLAALAGAGGTDMGVDFKIIMESRSFREDVVKRNTLLEYYKNMNKKKKSNKPVKKGKKEVTVRDAAEWLGKITTIEKDDKTGVYSIKVMMTDKEKVALIAQMYYDELKIYLRDKRMSKAKMNRIYVQKQLELVDAKLKEKEEELKMIEKRYNSVSIGDEAKAVAEMTAEIKKGILEKTNQLAIVKEFAGEENIEVKRLEKEISVYEKQLSALKTGGNKVPVDVVPLNDIPSLKIKLERLTRERAATAEVYKMLLVQSETAKIDEIKDSDVLNILDTAIEPEKPSKPSRKLGVIIGFVMGAFLGIFGAFVKEFISKIDFKKITE
jgi:uncharacterized protein involved in exopolysaccharide biosynthesis